MGSLPSSLQNSLVWPISAKGAVTRLNPLGDPKIATNYQKAMEQGRVLENSITDANYQLMEKKQQLLQFIATKLQINTTAVDAQNKHRLRKFLLIADSIKFLQDVAQVQQDISAITKALSQNIGMLQSIEQNMLGMVQGSLNALANLLNNICNWGLPDLPAIPNFFSDTVWNWNGFNFFPLAAFKSNVNFDFNFAFNQCVIHVPNINIFRNYPSTTQTYSGLTYGTPFFVPPLGGLIPNTGQNLSDPNFIALMQATNVEPYFLPTTLTSSLPAGATNTPFNPNSSMLGSVPDPSTIISNYQMPSQTYRDNIISVVPATRGITDPTALRSALVHYVNLQAVVDSNFDPNLTAEWLFYLDNSRTGRAGIWIPNIQAVYTELITPSVTYLANTPTPWNDVLGGTGVQDAPTAIPLITILTAVDAQTQQNLLWKLSYIEAAILGYTRNKNFDGGADNNFVSGFTGTDVDYMPTTITTATVTEVLGATTAEFPVSCTFPASIKAVLDQVIAIATINIQNNTSYQSPHPKFRFVYDQFAQATTVDRFTQFWREFNNNLQILLVQDPYLVQFVVTYVDSLDAAIDPLGDPTDYEIVALDVATRNRLWATGTPLLNIPPLPQVNYTNSSTPTDASNGWTAPPTDLDAEAFLSRPDIQGQPVPVQLAMLRTNLSYAGIQKFSQAFQTEISNQIALASAGVAAGQQYGFLVQAGSVGVSIPTGAAGVVVPFDTIVFDMTSNVTNATTFTIQQAGTYQAYGQLDWDTGAAGIRTVTIFQNGMPAFTDSTDPTTTGPFSQQFSTSLIAEVGDVIQVFASHDLPSSQNILIGSYFGMIQSSTNTVPQQLPSSVATLGKNFEADGTFATLSAVAIQPDGGVLPVNPVIPAITNVSINGSNVATITAANSFSVGQYILLQNLGAATFLNGYVLLITAVTGTTFTGAAPLGHAGYTGAETQGQAVLAIDATGVPLAPYPDGVTLAPATKGDTVPVGTNYGGVFQVSNTGWTVGGLLYVAADGTLTQDFDPLLTTVGWIICIGRVIATDTFLYEPHIPTRISNLF